MADDTGAICWKSPKSSFAAATAAGGAAAGADWKASNESNPAAGAGALTAGAESKPPNRSNSGAAAAGASSGTTALSFLLTFLTLVPPDELALNDFLTAEAGELEILGDGAVSSSPYLPA